MSDNVLLLGAGFSADAGIPMMASFVQTMRDMAQKRQAVFAGRPLQQADQHTLDEALALFFELDAYHGRARFSDRNIEDLLSILSFQALYGGKGSRSVDKLSRAIARTIELSCKLQNLDLIANPKVLETDDSGGAIDIYKRFWKGMFSVWSDTGQMPTIISLNYDLVLERSLVSLLVGLEYDPTRAGRVAPFGKIRVRYGLRQLVEELTLNRQSYQTNGIHTANGYSLSAGPASGASADLEVSLLKLHGSLNFPKSKLDAVSSLEQALDDPLIVPPVYSKSTESLGARVWRDAMSALRTARNLVVVGYSLPQTDTYMQYFLKAALGPNRYLDKITVYDPSLKALKGDELRERYRTCFSPQLQDRIDFEPRTHQAAGATGKATQFVYDLSNDPASIFFMRSR